MYRILRAFAWMRWRVLLNSLGRTGARDTLERLSLAVEQLGPIIAALLLVPSLLAMSALSGFAGYSLAAGAGRPITVEVLRYLTLLVTILAIFGPIVMPVMERANPVRLMLLPIPRATLYAAQASGALADPWTLLLMPVVLFLPLGLAVGGSVPGALLSFAAGLVLLVVVVGLSTLTACAVQLVVRDRRRGELVALAFILILPLAGILTSSLDRGSSRSRRPGATAPAERSSGARLTDRVARRAFSLTPSEQYVRATRSGVEGRADSGVRAVAVLAGTAAGLHAAAIGVFLQLLAAPGSVARRRAGRRSSAAPWRVPGFSRGTGAVAIAQIRLALRTPRGRSTLLSPLVVFIVLFVIATRHGTAPFGLESAGGVGLAAFSALMSILATLPLAMNQFAIDGSGLTLELLSPLTDKELLDGKALANGAIAGMPALLCMLAAFLLLPGSAPALWISVPFGALSVFLLVAPVAAALSATFPRAVDLNSVGNASNAHGLASLLGLGAVALAALPAVGLALLATTWLERRELAPVLLLMWCALTFGVNRLISRPLRALLAKRRENLSLVS